MEEGHEAPDVTGSSIRLYTSGLIASVLYISTGCVFSWTSPTFPILRKENAITPSEEPWVGSLFSFGAAFGPIIIAVFNDRIGRKNTLYLIASFFFLSWLILSASQNFYTICVGRIIGGIGVGGSFTGVSIFVAEISDAKRRGSMGSFNQSFMAIGFLIEYCIGPYISYLTLILISWAMIIIFFVLFYILPESPYYLIASGQKPEAVEALCWYRGDLEPSQVDKELTEIEKNVLNSPKQDFWRTTTILFTKRAPLKGLLISLYLLVLQQGSAYNAIIVYAQDIFATTQMKLAPEYSSMIIGATNLFASLPSPFLVRRFGLKPVLIVSGIGMGISMGLLSLYFFLLDKKYDVSSLDFLPITSIILYAIFFCCGLGPLTWAVVAEMFPIDVKSKATAFCGTFSFLYGFVVIALFSILTSNIGSTLVFFLLFLFIVAASVGLIFILPNTKGMSLQEIQAYLNI